MGIPVYNDQEGAIAPQTVVKRSLHLIIMSKTTEHELGHGLGTPDGDSKEAVHHIEHHVDYSNSEKLGDVEAVDDRTRNIDDGWDAAFVKQTMRKIDWRLIPGERLPSRIC